MDKQFLEIIQSTGEDVNREGLKDTPKRAARSFAFLTKGYKETLENVCNGAIFQSDMDELVIVKDIEVYSMCEHHLLPFIGHCHVGYIPAGKILGLSKIARIVDLYARRLQIQEQLTKQIAQAIMHVTAAAGVGVIIEAKHLCMLMRGIEKQRPSMTTSIMLGCLRDDFKTRQEFLTLVQPTQR